MGERKKVPSARKVIVEKHAKEYKLTEKICPVCNEPFLGTGKAVYDKPACRQKANYARHGAEYKRQQREKYHAEQKAKRF